jgi:hypothetical protein
VPVIFVTSSDRLEAMREGIEAGGDDFMVKGGPIQGYLERIGYWMRRRCLTEEERAAILRKVGSRGPARAAESAPKPAPEPVADQHAFDPSTVAQMAAFVAEARAGAPADFGEQASEKLVLLGYAAGVVNALANSNLEAKMRFVPHLRALLEETRLLSPMEIEASVGRWHAMYHIPAFSDACRKGEEDYARRLLGNADSPATPLRLLMV